MAASAGDDFQRLTKYFRGKLPGGGLDWASQPEPYKPYPNAERIRLPEPSREEGPPIWFVISRRRSLRRYRPEPLSLQELSQILWACQGITSSRRGYEFRASPSAGALYPVETYLVANSVDDLESGIYHYWIPEHSLDTIRRGDFRTQAMRAALDQEMAYLAPLVLLWTGVFGRSKWKYRQRAYRYVYLDAGHLAQNVALAAVALGLGSCQIGALYDEEVNSLLGIDGTEESAVYMTAVGRPLNGRR